MCISPKQKLKSQVADSQKQLAVADQQSAGIDALMSLFKNPQQMNVVQHEVCIALAKSLTGNSVSKEGALKAISALPLVEAFALDSLLSSVLVCSSDKSSNVRNLADEASKSLISLVSANAVRHVLHIVFVILRDNDNKWQTKLAALKVIDALVDAHPESVNICIPEIVPVVSEVMWDTKTQIREASTATMTKVCSVIGNQDIDAMIPRIISCICQPEEVPECVYALAATTFVKTVEAPTLAITVPLLLRGFNEPATAIKRQAAVIVDNMCKLVEDPTAIEQVFPRVLPKLERIIEIQSDPECRNMAEKARNTLLKVSGLDSSALKVEDEDAEIDFASLVKQAEEEALKDLRASLTKEKVKVDEELVDALRYTSGISSFLCFQKRFAEQAWMNSLRPSLSLVLPEGEINKVVKSYLKFCIEEVARKHPEQVEDQEEGEDLCNCEFSLAYGGMVLLNNARLRLKRGKRYGLCGPNGSGKTTLMRAIANGQLEGFPSPDVLKTVYVAHELQGLAIEDSVVDFIMKDARFSTKKRDEVIKALDSVGFTTEMHAKTVDSLSGGWKMKLELARAMLLQADILLMDEPTNHLDVHNVAWLENYLISLKDVTCMIVSHDSSFLDKVCTGIIHYETRKLKFYKGNLSEFVKVKPEAKSYYDLTASQFKFKFPEPGFLEGINSKDKAILKMKNVVFAYPGSATNSIHNMTIQCSLSSRIAIKGPNGAGKSTMVKLLTGELVPSSGEVWKHPNLRVAYVAQHAFHHLEQHLNMTPNQYIQWRYQYGEDRELLNKESRKIPEEELKLLEKPIAIEGVKRIFEQIYGRRKMKNTYEYEVKWQGFHYEQNTWHTRNDIEKWGFIKTLQQYDDREAALAGTYKRPLTSENVEKHLGDLGLEPEFATHRHIRGLSGGQKVKTVLAAAMWDHPHILVLDEPTNYLDRDSLGALASAIKEFGGGIVMISHHNEFTDPLCPEQWNVNAGVLSISGQVGTSNEKIEKKQETEMKDAFGNVVKVKAQKKELSRKEQREKERRKKLAKKNGTVIPDSDEDDY